MKINKLPEKRIFDDSTLKCETCGVNEATGSMYFAFPVKYICDRESCEEIVNDLFNKEN